MAARPITRASFMSLGHTLGMPLVSWRPEGVTNGMDLTGCNGASIASCTTENTEVTEQAFCFSP